MRNSRCSEDRRKHKNTWEHAEFLDAAADGVHTHCRALQC